MNVAPPEHFRPIRKLFWKIDYLVDYAFYIFLGKFDELEKSFVIEGLSFPTELSFLYNIAKSIHEKGSIVEIGSYRGRSTSALALGCTPDASVFAVDPLDKDGQEIFQKNMEKAGVSKRITLIAQESECAAKSWNAPIGLLFIDGNHSYTSVRKDLDSWKAHISEGGYLLFHDSYYPGVKKVLSEMVHEKHFVLGGKLASITFYTKGTVCNPKIRKFILVNRIRALGALISNQLKRIWNIDNAPYRET